MCPKIRCDEKSTVFLQNILELNKAPEWSRPWPNTSRKYPFSGQRVGIAFIVSYPPVQISMGFIPDGCEYGHQNSLGGIRWVGYSKRCG
jgi:hypothetical protein